MDYKKLLLVALPYLIVVLPSLFFFAFSTDEYTYMNTARAFAAGHYYGVGDSGIVDPSRFPLFAFLLSAPFSLFGSSEFVAKIVPIIFGLLAVFLAYELAVKTLGEKKGFIAAAVFSSIPAFSFLATRVLSESLFVLLFISCIYVLQEIAVEGKRNKFWLLGALFALLFLARYNGLALAIAIPLVLWKEKKLDWLFTVDALLAVVAFFAVLSPWLYYSQVLTGTPWGLAYGFAKYNVHVGEKLFMTLPDRIPTVGGLASIPGTTTVATFAMIGFPLLVVLWQLYQSKSRKRFLEQMALSKNGFVYFSAAISVAAISEAVGLVHPSLLRYVMPAAPFVSMLAAQGLEEKKKLYAIAIGLNVLTGLFLVVLFSPYAPIAAGSYVKQSLHRQVGILSEGCTSIASNMREVIYFYTGLLNENISASPQCIALSDYEGGYIGQVPSTYTTVFNQSGVRLFKRNY